jgi:hypothetical protein
MDAVNHCFKQETILGTIDAAIHTLKHARQAQLDRVYGRVRSAGINRHEQFLAEQLQTAIEQLQLPLAALNPPQTGDAATLQRAVSQ